MLALSKTAGTFSWLHSITKLSISFPCLDDLDVDISWYFMFWLISKSHLKERGLRWRWTMKSDWLQITTFGLGRSQIWYCFIICCYVNWLKRTDQVWVDSWWVSTITVPICVALVEASSQREAEVVGKPRMQPRKWCLWRCVKSVAVEQCLLWSFHCLARRFKSRKQVSDWIKSLATTFVVRPVSVRSILR